MATENATSEPCPRPHENWHALACEQAVARLDSDGAAGLSHAEARRRLERFGPNAIPASPGRSSFSIFIDQFKSPLIYLLFLAALIALAFGQAGDSSVILAVVLLNSLIGAFQEGRAERALDASAIRP